jgi:hypothetical protein
MLLRLAVLTLLAALPAGCESCEFSFGGRDPRIGLRIEDAAGQPLAIEAVDIVIAAASIEVCHHDHDDRDCATHPLADVLDEFEPDELELFLDLEGVYDGGSYERRTRCWFPGLALTLTAPGCTAEPLVFDRTKVDDHEPSSEPPVIVVRCP